MSLKIVKVAIPAPLDRLFDYLLPEEYTDQIPRLVEGIRVKVPFGRRQVMGFVIEIVDHTEIPKNRLKPISAILDETPLLPLSLMKLVHWTSQYYHHPLGEVIETALPAQLRKLKKVTPRKSASDKQDLKNALLADLDPENPILNEEQQIAFDAVSKSLGKFSTFLLQGVTGSGKTEVYLQLIQKVLKEGQQVLLLVPEISLTPQMVARLQKRLGNVIACFHSGLTDAQRLKSWQLIKTGQKSVMVGTRSSVFTPFKNLGIIIVDEEQDSSFKQQGGLAYHARDVAIVRARLENTPILLGSATPSLESFWNAKQGRYESLHLHQRASKLPLPHLQTIDLRNKRLNAGLSQDLLGLMEKHLTEKGQVLLFLNRRGFAPIYLCHGCGWVVMCSQCESPLRLHHRPKRLRCHLCEATAPIPSICPDCNQDQLFALGQGTQRLEEALQAYFPDIEPIRIDADTTRGKDRLVELLTRVKPNEPAILIGTQILAKGHHFPGVSLAAIIDGDAGLFGTDFRSWEQAAQLIMQVGGRSGRGNEGGEVVIQTHHPNHPLLNQVIQKGYTGFSELTLKERKKAGWPPFSHLALLRAETLQQGMGLEFLQAVKAHCVNDPFVKLLGPVPSLLSKRAGYYRAQLLIQSKNRAALHHVLNHLTNQLEVMPKRGVRYHLEVDPLEIC